VRRSMAQPVGEAEAGSHNTTLEGSRMGFEVSPVLVGQGLEFAEGINFDRDGMLYCVDIPRGAVCRQEADGALKAWVHTGGGPNGSRFGPAGDLFIADCGKRSILRLSTKTPTYTVYADQFLGNPLAGPNDLCFGPDGTLYFTDPFNSSFSNPIGCVYAVATDGAVSRVAEGLAFPNGLAVTGDGLTLIVGETHTGTLHRYALSPADRFAEQPPLAVISPAAETPDEAGPDGMAFGDDGYLYIAHYGTGQVQVVAPNGEIVAHLPSGGPTPTNVAFRDRSLYVTEGTGGAIYRLDIGVGELKPFMRPW
ncbi:MAG: SMP-30/gluconolactonase/LRE family protein, partial [Chloroflexota bacterium]